MKQIKQFRYYSSKNANNYPALGNYFKTLSTGNIFASHGNISHLGIQAIPGTKFYLNDSPNPIIIGATGIYELEMGKLGHIFAIRFDAETLVWYDAPGNTARILIDIVFEGGV